MKTYRVYGIWTGSKLIGEFTAATEDEAIDMACNSHENHASLCHQCSKEVELDDYSAQQFQAEEVEEETKC